MNDLHKGNVADSVSSGHFVIVLPFLRMRTSHTVASVEFLPLRDGDYPGRTYLSRSCSAMRAGPSLARGQPVRLRPGREKCGVEDDRTESWSWS